MIDTSNSKRCTKCETCRPLIDFHKKAKNKDGRAARCKLCVKEYCDKYYSIKINAPNSKQCTNCTELKLISAFSKNKRQVDGYHQWCKECDSVRAMFYNQSAHGKMVKNANRRTTSRFSLSRCKGRKAHGWSITRDQYYTLIAQDCSYCLLPYNNEYGIGLDRINCDLGYEIDNVTPCCGMCNKIKLNHLSYNEMLIVGQTIREIKLARISTFSS